MKNGRYCVLFHLERTQLCETGFGFGGFLHLIYETGTSFLKPKPTREIVHLFTLIYLLSSMLKLRLKVACTYSTEVY